MSHFTRDMTNGLFIKPIWAGILTFTGLVLICAYLTYQRYQLVSNTERQNAFNVVQSAGNRLQQALQYSLSATQAMTLLIDHYGEVRNFDSIAPLIFRAHKNIDAVQLVPYGVIRYVHPIEENEAVLNYDLLRDSLRNKEAYKAAERNQLYFAGPFPLRQGGIGVVGRLPVYRNDSLWGFSAVVIHLSTLLKTAGIDTTGKSGYYFQLSKRNPDTNEEEYFLPFREKSSEKNQVSTSLPEGDWTLSASPVDGFRAFQHIIAFALLGLLFCLLAGLFAVYYARTPVRLQQLVAERTAELDKSHEELRRLSNYLEDVREEERHRIAREIHDELGQHLTVLKMNFSFLEKSLADKDPGNAESIRKITVLIDEMVGAVRKISHELRPALLDQLGLPAAMESYAADFENKTGIKTSFYSGIGDYDLPDKLRIGLFRIFQESLTNVARHANATRVDTTLSMHEGELVLLIEDDGKGFNTATIDQRKTLGILGMKERAKTMGGSYTIHSEAGKGTTIDVIVPLNGH